MYGYKGCKGGIGRCIVAPSHGILTKKFVPPLWLAVGCKYPGGGMEEGRGNVVYLS